jgi:hypothetical protein
MNRSLAVATAAASALLTLGCATSTNMAFENDDERVTADRKPIFLMTATLKNGYKPSFQPRLLVVNVEKPDAKDKADRLNFKMDDKARIETDSLPDGNNYLLRMELAPGSYIVRGLTSMARSFPIIATFFAPMHSPIESREPGVYYLGHVSAVVRERQGEEFKAGPSIPLIDQAVGGASGGTFDIEISDRLAEDEAKFRERFVALKDVEIRKAILPPFDRKQAQSWWEDH